VERVAYFLHGHISISIEFPGQGDFLWVFRLQFRPPAQSAAGTSGLESGGGTFTDDFALKFSERPEYVEDEFAPGGRRINTFLQALEPYPLFIQVIDQFYELHESAAEPVESPDDQGISCPNIVYGFLQARPFSFYPAHRIGENFLTPCLPECIGLETERLILSRDTGIAYEHKASPLFGRVVNRKSYFIEQALCQLPRQFPV
jgi:hypothetical protein